MKRHIRHIRTLSIAALLASSLLSYGAFAVGRNAVMADSHVDSVAPETGHTERIEVAWAGGQIGRVFSHESGQVG